MLTEICEGALSQECTYPLNQVQYQHSTPYNPYGGGHFNGLEAGIRTACDVHKLKIKLEPEPFIIEPESLSLNLHSKIGVA